jgi:hypothetical protein
MSRLLRGVEDLDTRAPEQARMPNLHPVTFKNFLVEHGRMTGDKPRTLLHFIRVRAEPMRFLEMLRRAFEGRLAPKISYDDQVVLGCYSELGEQNAFSVVWDGELTDGTLGWIKRKVQDLDDALNRR